jgi:hypothetical protein
MRRRSARRARGRRRKGRAASLCEKGSAFASRGGPTRRGRGSREAAGRARTREGFRGASRRLAGGRDSAARRSADGRRVDAWTSMRSVGLTGSPRNGPSGSSGVLATVRRARRESSQRSVGLIGSPRNGPSGSSGVLATVRRAHRESSQRSVGLIGVLATVRRTHPGRRRTDAGWRLSRPAGLDGRRSVSSSCRWRRSCSRSPDRAGSPAGARTKA